MVALLCFGHNKLFLFQWDKFTHMLEERLNSEKAGRQEIVYEENKTAVQMDHCKT